MPSLTTFPPADDQMVPPTGPRTLVNNTEFTIDELHRYAKENAGRRRDRAKTPRDLAIEEKLKDPAVDELIFFERMRPALPTELTNTWVGDCSVFFLDRLFEVAHDCECDDSRAVADFLLSWLDSEKFGAFDVRAIWSVEESVGDNMLLALGYMNRHPHICPDKIHEIYPRQKNYVEDFQYLIEIHRPV